MDFEVYCDESRQEFFGARGPVAPGHFVLIGGIWIQAEERSTYKSGIARLRASHNVHGEFKWSRVSPSRGQFYLDLVRYFFDQRGMRFRCLVLPADQLHAVPFHDGDNELMFYKFYYQLLHHWVMDSNRYRVFVDAKTNRVPQRLAKLREVLQNSNRSAEIASVQALRSQEVDLLQLADLLIGAVGYKFHRGAASAAKVAVVKAIEDALGRPIAPTSKGIEKFNVFSWQPGRGW